MPNVYNTHELYTNAYTIYKYEETATMENVNNW